MKFFLTNPYMLRLYLIAALLMGVFVSVYNYLTFRLEEKPFSLSHFIIAFIFLMYIFGVFGTMIVGKLSKRFPMNTILKGSILFMLAGAMLLLSKNIYILIFGLGLFTLSFFAAHTMASQMTALYAKRGKSSATSIYWLFITLDPVFWEVAQDIFCMLTPGMSSLLCLYVLSLLPLYWQRPIPVYNKKSFLIPHRYHMKITVKSHQKVIVTEF